MGLVVVVQEGRWRGGDDKHTRRLLLFWCERVPAALLFLLLFLCAGIGGEGIQS